MQPSTATATVRSTPPRALDELRAVLVGAVAGETSVDPEQVHVTAVFSSDLHVLGLKVQADSDAEAMAALDRVEARLQARGVLTLNNGWRLLDRAGSSAGAQ